MKPSVQTKVEAMKKQTIGVEIEMYGIERSKASKVAAKFFGTNRSEYVARQYGYETWAAWDNQGRIWKFQKDISIRTQKSSEQCELVTPILTYSDIPMLQELVRQLRKNGAKSDPKHMCGVHIHIGADGHNALTLRNLTNIMASHEQILIDALTVSTSRIHTYCKTVNESFLNMVNSAKPKTMKRLSDIWYRSNGADYDRNAHYNNSRYHMLNLHSTFTKGTIEFRFFQFDNKSLQRQGGLHAGQLKSFIQLCLAMSQLAKTVTTASRKPQQMENPKYAMRTWLLRLGFIGEEFATARKVLTERLAGDAAFRTPRSIA